MTYKTKNLVSNKEDLVQEMESNINNTNEEYDLDNYSLVMQKIIEVQVKLQEIDEYFNELPNLQSKVDEELSDLLHYIENNDLTPMQSIKMIKLIREKRKERRDICNDIEIKRVYIEHKNKMTSETQRPFLLNSLYKRAKDLNGIYKERRYKEGEILALIKGREGK